MSTALRSTLVIAILVELVAGGWLLASRALRVPPALPADMSDDPLLAAEIRALAAKVDRGGAPEWRMLGEGLLGQGAYAHAESAFARAAALAPQDIEALFGHAFCIDRTGRMAASNPLYRRCLDLPDRTEDGVGRRPFALYAIGRNLLRLDDVQGAEAAFRENASFLPAQVQLAKLLVRDGRLGEAVRIVDDLLRQLPLALELHQLKARILEAAGAPAEAFLARAMEERSAHLVESNFSTDYVRPFTTRLGMPRVLQEVESRLPPMPGDPRRDPAVLEREIAPLETLVAEARVPQRATLAFLRGALAADADDVAGITAALGIVDAAGDRSVSRLELEALVRDRMGDAVTATALRERAVAMGPSPQLHRRLAEERERQGDDAAARHHRARAHFHLGKAAYRRNRLEDALREFREAAVHDDRHVATWYRAGEMAYHLGRRTEAAEAFRRVVDLEPDHERALRWLDLLVTATVPGPSGG